MAAIDTVRWKRSPTDFRWLDGRRYWSAENLVKKTGRTVEKKTKQKQTVSSASFVPVNCVRLYFRPKQNTAKKTDRSIIYSPTNPVYLIYH